MPENTHTKILATIGPASSTKEVLEQLVDAGADAFRFNFSHGTHEEHAERYGQVREIAKAKQRHICIVADLQGPKLRVGQFAKEKVFLKEGAEFVLDMKDELGDENRVTLPHPEIFQAIKAGDNLLLNDGNITLTVAECSKDYAKTIVKFGGWLSSHKGVNLPNIKLPISALTEKDRKDLEFALSLGVDWISLSFVQTAQDVKMAKDLIKNRAFIVSKLEKPSAIDELDEIVKLSDAVMVARGDLGVECPIQSVPLIQKKIIATCRKYAKPVIVATQMLESMINAPTPTRAEVSDVATAVMDGVDTVMLSAETAVGSYPKETVAMMHKIIEEVEKDDSFLSCTDARNYEHRAPNEADAITIAAGDIAKVLDNVACIVTYSVSGYTTFLTARERPHLPILAITPSLEVARRLGICWGVKSFVNPDVFAHFNNIENTAVQIAVDNNFAKPSEHIIITAGYPFGKVGSTNLLHTVKIPEK